MVLKLQTDAEAEKSALEKSEALLTALVEKEPKIDDIPLDEDAEREKILQRQQRTKRPPGDPLYIPMLTDKTQKTDINSLPKGKAGEEEGKRRKRIRNNLILTMKISVNGKMLRNEDGTKREVKLQQRKEHDFSFTVNEDIKLAATSGNPQIVIHICESKGPLMTAEIANLIVPIAEDASDDRGDPYVFQDSRTECAFEPSWYEGEKKGSSKAQHDDRFRSSGLHFITGELVMKVTSLSALQSEDGTVTVNINDGTVKMWGVYSIYTDILI